MGILSSVQTGETFFSKWVSSYARDYVLEDEFILQTCWFCVVITDLVWYLNKQQS